MIEVYCIRGAGNREMGEVSDPLLRTEFDAVLRGTYEINKQWFYEYIQSLSVLYKKANDVDSIIDGDIVFVSDSLLGISENKKVKSIILSGTSSEINMEITTCSYGDSE